MKSRILILFVIILIFITSCLGVDALLNVSHTSDTDFGSGSLSDASVNGTGSSAALTLAPALDSGTGADGPYTCTGSCSLPGGTYNYQTVNRGF